LSSVESAEPGAYRTSRTPFAREPMDALSANDPTEQVVMMFCAQVCKTEVGNNWVGACIQDSPGPMLIVQPTQDMARRWGAQRLSPLIESTPALRELVAESRSRDSTNTQTLKEFRGGVMVIAGANSPSGLASMPVRRLFLDEVDRFPPDAGGEGDPVDIALKRTSTFRSSRKILITSTPTIKGYSRIEAAYAASDRRVYYVPCPSCGTFQPLRWGNVKWPKGEPRKAQIVCREEECEHRWTEPERLDAIALGQWQETEDGDGVLDTTIPELPKADRSGRVRGYHLNILYSPWVAPGEAAAEWYEVHKDPVRLKVWINTRLGETWDESASERRIDTTGLAERCEVFAAPCPAGVAVLTAGVDTQDDRLEVEVVGWSLGEESFSIDHRVIYGDPSAAQVWRDLDRILTKAYRHERGGSMRISVACVDTGGHHTLAAYRYCKSHEARARPRVWAIKGRGGQDVIPWPRKPSRSNKGKVNLFVIGVDSFKADIFARLGVDKPGPGYMHFPLERADADYFDQLTAEYVSTRYVKGFPKREWKKRPGARNEALDLRVYATAALEGWKAMGGSIARALDKVATKGAGSAATAAPTTKRKARDNGFIGRKKHWL
jgi:phage terminase large subunit GpA-like protein